MVNIRQMIKPGDLMGATEAAQLLRIHKSNFLSRHAKRPDFPPPLAVLASGRVWWRAEVAAYKAALTKRGSSDGNEQKATARTY